MKLNMLKPARGSKSAKKRLGRGPGSGLGKTCGKGHKGQKARAGGYHKVGFQGGQMSFQRRVPKVGFRSRKALFREEIGLDQLEKFPSEVVDLLVLREAGIVPRLTKQVKIILRGTLSRKIRIKGIPVTRGAKQAIEAVGGQIEA